MQGRTPRWILHILVMTALLLTGGCAMVGVHHIAQKDYTAQRRSDVLNTRTLSDSTLQSLNVVALSRDECAANFTRCTNTLLYSDGLDNERRLSALAELWLALAMQSERDSPDGSVSDKALNAYLQSARYAYAYLFYTARHPGERAFETRQSQVLAFYNYATQRAVMRFFQMLPTLGTDWSRAPIAGWDLLKPDSDVYLGSGDRIPRELIPAEGLRFSGLRNIYRRDGFGSEFVAIGATPAFSGPWRESNYVPLTAVLEFPGDTLQSVLDTHDVRVYAKNPYLDSSIPLDGQSIPLAGNFTAPYGVWLAQSGFAGESLRALFGRGGLSKPEVWLMQPYDPNRLTVIMLHGLASSPEAWINVVNEVMGDEQLRRTYQVWEVYYPTNVPVAVNLAQIRQALDNTLHHFDPSGTAPASHNIVLIGHSMGGVIARLLVSSSDDKLWSIVTERPGLSTADKQKLRQRLAPYLQFSPMPQVTRAVFLAAPHRGTPVARWKLARWIAGLIRLPLTLLEEGKNITDAMQGKNASSTSVRVPNSIDNLSDSDPFIKAASTLPISPTVHYHTIVGVYKSNAPLTETDDGVVPYASAHLDGADSELAVPSWHNVQDAPQAIIELRRILRLHAAALHCTPPENGEPLACATPSSTSH
ncbi:esterase/lipase family protein [Dyella nitratireducens]|uniref:Alpha/beta hydrolase n=1 Tax=Dyella nitratireducens TaxID=1849580 RepID=A0ABQ1GTK0_9GAMM|nr:alpha/beta hydrolase [Dyella nitratireducens]GGA49822.1 alpha/beta hydrolase [Dyella nitratireducens]GLQ42505.1 alpha/beta hydrolase [Dyella nitratireducens]